MSPSDEEDGPPDIAVYPGGDRRPQLDRAAWPLCLVVDDDVQLLGRLTGDELLRNGVPDEVTALRRCTAHEAVLRRVGPRVDPLLARVSPLGGEWSADIDVHSVQRPDDATLAGWGWLRVDALLRWIGSDTRDRWAVREDGLVVGAVDFHSGPPPDPVTAVLERAARRRGIRIREVLELRALRRAEAPFPQSHPALPVAAAVEAAYGGSLLAPWRDGPPQVSPDELSRTGVPTAPLLRVLRRMRSRSFRVAISGVDGAGKSTIARSLTADLSAAGVPTASIWTRPGLDLRYLVKVARMVKRWTGQSREPGIRRMAGGAGERPLSRRGLVGLVWTLAVTADYLVRVRRKQRVTRGVAVYDRHVLDALATLHVFYRGAPLAVPTALVRRLLPRVDITIYLRVPAGVACARKPDRVIGDYAVRAQVAEYERLLPTVPDVLVLDATRPLDELTRLALDHVVAAGAAAHSRRRRRSRSAFRRVARPA